MAVESGSLIATVVAADREQRLASARSLADARRANLQRVRDITESVSQQRTAAEQLQRNAQQDRVRVSQDRIRTDCRSNTRYSRDCFAGVWQHWPR